MPVTSAPRTGDRLPADPQQGDPQHGDRQHGDPQPSEARPGDPRPADGGFTLVEMLFAMMIFVVLMSVFAAGISDFSRSTVRTMQTSDQTTQSRVIFNLLDRQVRSAAAINRPVQVGTNWYLEYRNDSVIPSTCTQWVYRRATSTLAVRTWNTDTGSTPPVPAWRVLATDVVNTAAEPPFAFTAATGTVPLQGLSVSLRFQRRNSPLLVSTSRFTARNSTVLTESNPDVNADGVSDYQFCQDFGGSTRP